MSDVLSLRYLGVEVYDKKEVKTTQDVLRYDNVDPDHVQALSSEARVSQRIYLQVPSFFARLRKWIGKNLNR